MKPEILFVNLLTLPLASLGGPSSKEPSPYMPISIPLGILYLSSYIRKHNDVGRVGILDYVLDSANVSAYPTAREFIRHLALNHASFAPDILAFSFGCSASHDFFALCLDELKTIWPEAKTVVGGVHATNCTRQVLENKNVDYVVRGEGEIAFSDFLHQFDGSKDITVKGVYSHASVEQTSSLELAHPITDLDQIPFPDWELIEMNKYVSQKGRRKSIGNAATAKMAEIVTTRGCPFKCTFCSGHTVHGRTVRSRSVENVVGEMKLLHEKYGVTLFIPGDDLFTASKQRTQRLLKAIKGLEITNLELHFTSGLRINSLDAELMDDLVDAGMTMTYLAIESGSPDVQKHIIKKNVDLVKAKYVASYLRSKGVVVRCYVILGFPGETKEQMRETIDYVRELDMDWCSFLTATPLVGSEMYDQFLKLGYIRDDADLWSKTIFVKRTFDTREISAQDLNELAYIANLEINFINNPNKVKGSYERAISLYNDIVESYPFHVIGWHCMMECYRMLGRSDKVAQVQATIASLLESDPAAQEMFKKYGHLIADWSA
ncbi:MAG: B12-binding domain-containing radical SAM protein [Desulfomonile tiedjei]|nr:B12-binding domain-containing radical SAM protein [Desulfomonile tiedjei]